MELLDHLTPELGLGEHTTHGDIEDVAGSLLHEILIVDALEPARVAAVMIVGHPFGLEATGHFEASGINGDHMVACVDMWREDRLVLAPQDRGYFDSSPTEGDTLEIQHIPLSTIRIDFRQKRFHTFTPSKVWASS